MPTPRKNPNDTEEVGVDGWFRKNTGLSPRSLAFFLKPKEVVVMPKPNGDCFTTLTTYYNVDVVLAWKRLSIKIRVWKLCCVEKNGKKRVHEKVSW